MKCYECKYSKKSKSKIHKYWCKQFKVHAQDDLAGCIDGEQKKQKSKSL